MNGFVCNYATARFRPYRETGEFVNVGVVLVCPELDFFGHLFERRKHKRVTDFFPELDLEVFNAGLSGMLKELSRLTGAETAAQQRVFGEEAKARIAAFKELVRPRETLFHFGEVGTVLAADPAQKLKELFCFYIKRQFAHEREYQEIIMRRQLGEFLQKVNLARFYRQDYRVGTDDYGVTLPFVYLEGNAARKAIKPLHLDKKEPTEIYRHGDAWIASVRRLRNMNCLPREVLFAVKAPFADSKRQAAAREICAELEQYETLTVPFAQTERIRSFANID
jgi:hypothetical protein